MKQQFLYWCKKMLTRSKAGVALVLALSIITVNGQFAFNVSAQVAEVAVMTVSASTNDSPITLPTSQALLMSVAENHFSTEWSFVSGPGPTPTIETPDTAYTTVTGLTVAGTYTFKITAYNFGKTQSVDATVEVEVLAEGEGNGGGEEEDKATISATKIVCDSEAYLPNWGEDDDNPTVTATTAAEFLAAGDNDEHCWLQDGWKFEWAPNTDNPGDNDIGPAGAPWTPTGETDANGVVTFEVPIGDDLVWVREQMQPGYYDFTGPNTEDDVSAELHCNTDSINYDNVEWVSPRVEGETYHCVAFNVQKKATVSATKIVCNSEADLPNWGLDDDNPIVTETTASEFLGTHPNCHLQEGWKFEWAPEGTENPGDNIEAAGGAWTQTGVTAADGTISFTVPVGTGLVWVREQLKDGYIPFTGNNTTQNVSAELHCHTDSFNYDNFEWLATLENGKTYHCVAFNAPVQTPPVDVCPNLEGLQPEVPQGYILDNQGQCVRDGSGDETETIVIKAADLAANIGDVISDPTSWFFYNDETDVIDSSLGSFVNGPATAPLGDGSAQITVTGSQRRNLATSQFGDVDLTDITQLKFSTYNPSVGNGGSANNSGYLNFNVDFNGSNTWQNRLAFVPSQNDSVTQDSWQEWDAIDSGTALWWWSGYAKGPDGKLSSDVGGVPADDLDNNTWPDGNTNEYRTWSNLLVSFPNIQMNTGGFSWLGLRVGEPYPDGYTENLDKFVIGIDTGSGIHTTTYDFEPTVTVCSDGIDNDNDGKVDADDPGCHTDGNSTNSQTYNINDNDETDPTLSVIIDEEDIDDNISNITQRSGSSGSMNLASFTPSPTPQVLGESTDTYCEEYLKSYIELGAKNNPEEVKKLQMFLNEHLGLNLTVDGVYGKDSYEAVKAFQTKYLNDVLTPWVNIGRKGVADGTGYVYKTTKRWINLLMCPDLQLPLPELP